MDPRSGQHASVISVLIIVECSGHGASYVAATGDRVDGVLKAQMVYYIPEVSPDGAWLYTLLNQHGSEASQFICY